MKEITPEIVLKIVKFQGSTSSRHISEFKTYISNCDVETLKGFIKFSTGSSSISHDTDNSNNVITVTFENAGENPKKLPISHTCWK